jgi:autotransporter-associated beta strand protein
MLTHVGVDVNNYSITLDTANDYVVDAKAITISGITASDKVYNGNTTATIDLTNTIFTGLVDGDNVTISATGTFSDKNVGTDKTVTLVETNGGTDVGNYTITAQGTTTADITKAPLTYTVAANDKVYDGNTTATATLTLSGFVGTETVTATNGATFDNKNVGTDKTVTVNSITLADGTNGGLATNYSITTGETTTADITAKLLTVNAELTSATKVYDGTTTAAVTSSELIGLVGDEDVTASGGGNYDNANVGTGKAITISYVLADGETSGLASNYTIAEQTTNSGVITKAPLTYTVAANDKVYDGNTTATATLTLSGFVGTETVTATNGATFDNKNVGTDKTVTVNSITLADGTNGGLATNYSITTGETTTADITAYDLTATIADVSETYGADVSAGSVTLDSIGLDDVAVSASIVDPSYSTALKLKAGTYSQITGATADLTGDDAANYTLTATTSTDSVTVFEKLLSLSGYAVVDGGKTYDGSRDAVIDTSGVTYNGLEEGDDITVTATGTFSSKDVGVGKIVSLSRTYAGDDRVNYLIASDSTTTGDIRPYDLTATIADVSETYGADVSAGSVTLDSIGLDDVAVSASIVDPSYSTALKLKAGTYSQITGATADLTGDDAANYTLTATTSTDSVTVAQYDLTATIADVSETYGADVSAGSVTLDSIGLDDVAVSASIVDPSYSTALKLKAGTYSQITGATADLTGDDAANYTLTATTSTDSVTVDAKAITISGITASDKVYNGNTTATIDLTNTIFTGLVDGDNVTISATGTFSDKNVGTDKTVTLVETNGGTDVGNYTITAQGTTTADITKAPLTYTVIAEDKTYDGGNEAQVSITLDETDFIDGESVSVSAATATFADANAAADKTVIVTAVILEDGVNGLASNYAVNGGETTTATINKKVLTVDSDLIEVSKVYDATTRIIAANITNAPLVGLIGDEDVSASGSGSFVDPNAGSNLSYTITYSLNNGDEGSKDNYQIFPQTFTNGTITPATLTVIALDNAKFAASDDPLFGVSYSGFKGTDSQSDTNINIGTVTREGTAISAGQTEDLIPVGFTVSNNEGQAVGNYTIATQNGTMTILDNDAMLIRLGNTTLTYGETSSYPDLEVVYWVDGEGEVSDISNSISKAQYDAGSTKGVYINGDSFKINDAAGTRVVFDVSVSDPSLSSSDNLNVGTYSLASGDATITGDNFTSLFVVGNRTISTKIIDANDLTFTSITKPYDGDALIDSQTLNYSLNEGSDNPIISGDSLNIVGIGAYNTRHVGTDKLITVDLSLDGDDAANYAFTGDSELQDTIGTITQLSSVTWVGSGETTNWSDSANWNGGALPDQSNVGQIQIGSGYTSTYDIDDFGATSSSIVNEGVLILDSASDYTLANTISGRGSVTKSGAATLVLSAINSYIGSTTLSQGTLSISSDRNLGGAIVGRDVDNIIFNGGLLQTTENITLQSNRGITLSANATISPDAGTTLTYAGIITGAANLTKAGEGTLSLSGTSTFTGDTAISQGTVELEGNLSASTDLVISSGAILDLQTDLTVASLNMDGEISNSIGNSNLTVNGTSSLGGSITTSGAQSYKGAATITGDTTLSTSSAQVTFASTINSETGEANDLTVTASELDLGGEVGGSVGVGVIDLKGNLDLNAAISSATSLSVSGSSDIAYDITTRGNQTYTGAVVISAGAGDSNSTDLNYLDIISLGGDITFNSTLKAGTASKENHRSLRINGIFKAGNNYVNAGNVTFNDNVGFAFTGQRYQRLYDDNFWSLDVTGNNININADIMTFEAQEYSGPILIGDNGENGKTRRLMSIDPSVNFNHTINDSDGTHTLIVEAYALSVDDPVPPTITANDEIGNITAFAAPVQFITGVHYNNENDPSNLWGTLDRSAPNHDGQFIDIQGIRTPSGSVSFNDFAANIPTVNNPATSSSTTSSSVNSNEGGSQMSIIQRLLQQIKQNSYNLSESSGGGTPVVEVGAVLKECDGLTDASECLSE